MKLQVRDTTVKIIEELIGGLDDALDFMSTFEGYEDEDAVKRREEKVSTLAKAEVFLLKLKEEQKKE